MEAIIRLHLPLPNAFWLVAIMSILTILIGPGTIAVIGVIIDSLSYQ